MSACEWMRTGVNLITTPDRRALSPRVCCYNKCSTESALKHFVCSYKLVINPVAWMER